MFVEEKMLDSEGEKFEYFECEECGCLQILNKPLNMDNYYANYYTSNKKSIQIDLIRKAGWKIRAIFCQSGLYNLISRLSYNSILHWAHSAGIKFNSRILDVGCGSGDILVDFRNHGFKNLSGIDPMLNQEIEHEGINLKRLDIFSVEEKYDFIMFNHSFEHIWNQAQTLKKAAELLNENGVIMIRIPVNNQAFKDFGEYWYQIDAPRHFFLHSIKSLNILVKKLNLKNHGHYFDSTFMQFVGSIEYQNGLRYNSSSAYRKGNKKSLFSQKKIEEYKERAASYNRQGLGDQGVFFFKK
jgi:SAM-dependent methyltransferase